MRERPKKRGLGRKGFPSVEPAIQIGSARGKLEIGGDPIEHGQHFRLLCDIEGIPSRQIGADADVTVAEGSAGGGVVAIGVTRHQG